MFWPVFTFLVFVLSFFGDEKYSKDRITRIVVRALLAYVLSYAMAFYSEGTDRVNYLSIFNELGRFDLHGIFERLSFGSDEMELGFFLLAHVCRFLGFSAIGFFFVVSLLTNSLAVHFFYRFRYPVFVFLLYLLSPFFVQQSNLVRQMLAVAISLYGIKYILEKNLTGFLLFVFLSFTVHRSAVILLLLTPLVFYKEDWMKGIKIVLFVLWILSFGFVFNLFPSLDFLSIYFEGTVYENYASFENDLGHTESRFNPLYNLFVLFSLLFVNKPRDLVYVVYFVLGCVFGNAAFGAPYFFRLSLFFIPMFSAYLPTLLVENKIFVNQKNMLLNRALQVLVFVYYLRLFIISRFLKEYSQIGYKVGSLFDIFQ